MTLAAVDSFTCDQAAADNELRRNDTAEVVNRQYTIVLVDKVNGDVIAQGRSLDELRAQVLDDDGNPIFASVSELSEVEATADEAIARWTLSVIGSDADGNNVYGQIIAGADGEAADLILAFDRIALGRVNGSKVYPFVLDGDGEIIIDTALIDRLTFGKITDESGSFVVDSQGRLKAEYIDVDNLQVNYSVIVGDKPPSDADNTADNPQPPSWLSALIKAADLDSADVEQVLDALNLVNAPAEAGAEQTAGKSLSVLVDRVADNIGESATRKWAAESGAETTTGKSMTVLVDRIADNIQESTLRKWANESGADITSGHQGDISLANLGEKELSSLTNRIADFIQESASRKWAAESGANVTGNHTSADTDNVAGTPASTVRDNASSGKTADERTADWARDNHATLIDGRKIFTGDAYVDTLQIQGEAVTVDRAVFFTDSETINEDGWQLAADMTIPAGEYVDNTSVKIQFGGFLRLRSRDVIDAEGMRVRVDGSIVRTFDFAAFPVAEQDSPYQVLVDQPSYGFIVTLNSSSHTIEVEVDLSDVGSYTPERRLENWFITVSGAKR